MEEENQSIEKNKEGGGGEEDKKWKKKRPKSFIRNAEDLMFMPLVRKPQNK